MKWSCIVATCVALLSATVQGAPKDSLASKVAELNARTKISPLIDMTSADFSRFFTGEKNYTMFVTFTALDPSRKCRACKIVYDEFNLAAQSFQYTSEPGVYFVSFDFEKSQRVFQKFNINSAPLIWHFPAKGDPTKRDKLEDFYRKAPRAEMFAKFITDRTGIECTIYRPIDWTSRMITLGITILIIYLLVTFFPTGLFMHFAGPLFCMTSMLMAICFTGGYMYNQIRGANMYGRDEHGKNKIFTSFGNQSITETMAVMMM
eukprot:Ihof_evm7s40 gene=Ihof_evmTU7s40